MKVGYVSFLWLVLIMECKAVELGDQFATTTRQPVPFGKPISDYNDFSWTPGVLSELAELSRIAYVPKLDRSREIKPSWQLLLHGVRFLHVRRKDNSGRDVHVFAFRGTATTFQETYTDTPINDYTDVANLAQSHSYGSYEGIEALLGFIWAFRNDLNHVATYISDFLDHCLTSNSSVIFTGHSLGGAMANIAGALSAKKGKQNQASIVTFGAPSVFSPTTAQWMRTVFPSSSNVRIINKYDLIPDSPEFFPALPNLFLLNLFGFCFTLPNTEHVGVTKMVTSPPSIDDGVGWTAMISHNMEHNYITPLEQEENVTFVAKLATLLFLRKLYWTS